MPRRRLLSEDERLLWEDVARSVRPKPNHHSPLLLQPVEGAHPARGAGPVVAPPAPKDLIEAFRVGEKTRAERPHALRPTISQEVAASPLRMDARTHARMTKGKLVPEARIDLHGMTLSEAHSELVAFLLNAQSGGLRLVLVITGKGKPGHDLGPIPLRTGALRHQVPVWLRLPPLAPAVQQVAEAHFRHGGSGAYYVYLRRR